MPKVNKLNKVKICGCWFAMNARAHFKSPHCIKTEKCLQMFEAKGLREDPVQVAEQPVQVVQAMEEPLIEAPWLLPSSEEPEEWPCTQATEMVIDAINNFSARKTDPEGMTFCIDLYRPAGSITLCSQMGLDSPYNRQVDCHYDDVKWDYILWHFGPDRHQPRVIHRMRARDGHYFVVSERNKMQMLRPPEGLGLFLKNLKKFKKI